MVFENIVFGMLAAVMILAAWRLVTTQNVVRAALFLVIVLAGVAGQYVLLSAEFVFAVQIVVYIGAIVVLFLFGIMLTRAPIGRDAGLDNDQKALSAIVALFFLGVLGVVIVQAWGDTKLQFPKDPALLPRAADLGDAFLGPYVVPFEVVSVLLLAALVGAVAIARRD
ncbi:MAG: NADH-quinone oxidoreductase subunit J [Actinobacteria bacterium]|nr:MAG: NADH-quinone oxidoreductase subunit J [Actinomycetota bacterium]